MFTQDFHHMTLRHALTLCLSLGGLLEVLANKLRDIIITTSSFLGLDTGLVHLLNEAPELVKAVRAHVVKDAREHVIVALDLVGAADNISVGVKGSLNPGVNEIDDNIVLEDVNLLNTGDGVAAKTLESALKLLVVSGGDLVGGLFLPPNGTLATSAGGRSHLHKLIAIHF